MNKLEKFITSATFYITKAKQTIIATLQTPSPFYSSNSSARVALAKFARTNALYVWKKSTVGR